MAMRKEGQIHTPGGMEQGSWIFPHDTRNGMQLETYEWFISGIFYRIFSNSGGPWKTENKKSETADNGGLL